MSKYQIRKEIAALINSIKEHSDNIGDSKYIPQLELESILHKIERLHERSIVFNYLNSLPEEMETEKPAEMEQEQEKTPEPVNVVAEPKAEVVIKEEVKESKPTEPTVASSDLFGSELPPVVEKAKVEKKEEKKQSEKPTAKTITKPAITDLKAAIGINDRVQFTNELFQGNTLDYTVAIEQFNSSESFESAMTYFLSLKLLYNWDVEKDTVKRLMDLISRRFS